MRNGRHPPTVEYYRRPRNEDCGFQIATDGFSWVEWGQRGAGRNAFAFGLPKTFNLIVAKHGQVFCKPKRVVRNRRRVAFRVTASLRRFCRVRPAESGEHRVVACHSGAGPLKLGRYHRVRSWADHWTWLPAIRFLSSLAWKSGEVVVSEFNPLKVKLLAGDLKTGSPVEKPPNKIGFTAQSRLHGHFGGGTEG